MHHTHRPCQQCGSSTKNPKFCSRNCSAQYNNHIQPKRCLTNRCKLCNVLIKSQRTYCKDCYIKNPKDNWKSLRLCDIHRKAKYQINACVRIIARKVYRESKLPKRCSVCNYQKHYEICHIKPISSFSPNTLLTVINAIENLIGLCPNCHWELDHGLLKI